jgi:hypothetical protein
MLEIIEQFCVNYGWHDRCIVFLHRRSQFSYQRNLRSFTMTSKQYLLDNGVTDTFLAGMDEKAMNRMAKAHGWEKPKVTRELAFVKVHTPTKGKNEGKTQCYLILGGKGYGDAWIHLNAGETVTPEGQAIIDAFKAAAAAL